MFSFFHITVSSFPGKFMSPNHTNLMFWWEKKILFKIERNFVQYFFKLSARLVVWPMPYCTATRVQCCDSLLVRLLVNHPRALCERWFALILVSIFFTARSLHYSSWSIFELLWTVAVYFRYCFSRTVCELDAPAAV